MALLHSCALIFCGGRELFVLGVVTTVATRVVTKAYAAFALVRNVLIALVIEQTIALRIQASALTAIVKCRARLGRGRVELARGLGRIARNALIWPRIPSARTKKHQGILLRLLVCALPEGGEVR